MLKKFKGLFQQSELVREYHGRFALRLGSEGI